MAHSYVRYLGDLSGGQYLKRMLVKAYGVDDSAMTFYEFRKLGGTENANIGDMKKLKEWFKDAMDQGIGEDSHQKRAVVDEAQEAFRLNGALLDLLAAPPPAPVLVEAVPVTVPVVVEGEKPIAASSLVKLSIPLAGIALAIAVSHLIVASEAKGKGSLLAGHFHNAARWFMGTPLAAA